MMLVFISIMFFNCDNKDDDGSSIDEKTRADLIELQEALKSDEYKQQGQMNQQKGDEARRDLKARINKKREEDCRLTETFGDEYDEGIYEITVVMTDKNWVPLPNCASIPSPVLREDDRLGTVLVTESYEVWSGVFTSTGEDGEETFSDKDYYLFKIEQNDSKSYVDLNTSEHTISEGKTTFNFKNRDVTIKLLSKFDIIEEYVDKIENLIFKRKFNFDVVVSGVKYSFVILEEDLDLTEEQESYTEDIVFIVSTVKLYKENIHIGYVSVYSDLTMDILDMDKNMVK